MEAQLCCLVDTALLRSYFYSAGFGFCFRNFFFPFCLHCVCEILVPTTRPSSCAPLHWNCGSHPYRDLWNPSSLTCLYSWCGFFKTGYTIGTRQECPPRAEPGLAGDGSQEDKLIWWPSSMLQCLLTSSTLRPDFATLPSLFLQWASRQSADFWISFR